MNTSTKTALYIILGVLAGVVVAGCAGIALSSGNLTSQAVPDEEVIVESQDLGEISEPAPVDSPAAEDVADAPTEAGSKAAGESLASNEVAILTEDDRSSRLRSVTSSWGTNWNRHTIDYGDLLSGGPPRDGIPSIDDPQFVDQAEAEAWLTGNEPVMALEIDGEARAYPLQIITWHEIVNDVVGEVPVAVTFCPLCNSAITFDRRFDGEVFEFGTSGLLRNSDLVMYDRTTETLWQQFTGEGIVGDLAGEQLTFIATSLISFDNFRDAYPDGMVLSRETGFSRNYGSNPYVGYDDINNSPFLFTGDLDGRLRPMDRVVTVTLDDVDVAYPLSILSEVGVIQDTQGGQDMVVFHVDGTSSALGARQIAEAEDVGATGVFDPNWDGQVLSFQRDGAVFVDDQTGSTWNIVGQAVDGPLAGAQLAPVVHADHFWFSWAAFRPDTIIYSAS